MSSAPDAIVASLLLPKDAVTRFAMLMSAVLFASLGAQGQLAPSELPATAVRTLDESLAAARTHARHVWRDTPPLNADGTVNAYVEIPRGDRRKFELDMATNVRAIDRMIPTEVGGYPINYGFVPQTVSYDGDPFDALVLGPPLPGGQFVRGTIVGLMLMEDEKGLDSKVVLSPAGSRAYSLTESIQRELADYFNRYKQHEPGAFARVPGWGTPADGLALIRLTHAFFTECRGRTVPCSVSRSGPDAGSTR